MTRLSLMLNFRQFEAIEDKVKIASQNASQNILETRSWPLSSEI